MKYIVIDLIRGHRLYFFHYYHFQVNDTLKIDNLPKGNDKLYCYSKT